MPIEQAAIRLDDEGARRELDALSSVVGTYGLVWTFTTFRHKQLIEAGIAIKPIQAQMALARLMASYANALRLAADELVRWDGLERFPTLVSGTSEQVELYDVTVKEDIVRIQSRYHFELVRAAQALWGEGQMQWPHSEEDLAAVAYHCEACSTPLPGHHPREIRRCGGCRSDIIH